MAVFAIVEKWFPTADVQLKFPWYLFVMRQKEKEYMR